MATAWPSANSAAKHFGLVLGFVRLVRGEERYMDAQLLGFVEHLRSEARGAVVKCPVADLDIRFAGLHLFLQLADLGSILAPLGKRLFHDVIEPLVLGAKLFELRGLILVIGERRGKLGSERLAPRRRPAKYPRAARPAAPSCPR